MSKFNFRSPVRKADADKGVEGNAGLYTTDKLPESGHNEALDDDQQPFAAGSPEGILHGVAEKIEGADIKLATRLKNVARELHRKRFAFGITETNTPEFEQKYSTAELHFPSPEDSSALDDGDQPHDLEFWGTHAPEESQVGPRPDPSRTAGVEHTDFEDWDNGEEPDEDYGEEVGGHGTCPECGGELHLLGQLGNTKHYRCRQCGLDFNTGLSQDHEEDEEEEPESREASKRKADPFPEWLDTMDGALELIDDELYEAEEPEFHKIRDELEQTVEKGKSEEPKEEGFMRGASKIVKHGDKWDVVSKEGKHLGGPYTKKKALERLRAVKYYSDHPKASRKTASAESLPEVEVWDSLKKGLRKASSGGQWGVGSWRTYTNDYGKVLDFHLDTHDSDGAPRVAGQVTISLDKEDPKKRVARVTVHDPVVSKKTRQIDIPYSQINRFARDMAGSLENIGKEILKGY